MSSSVSIGRLEQGGQVIRVLVNVGDLALNEDRFPEDETYALAQWGVAREVMTDGVTQTARLGTSDCDPDEAELLRSLGKESSVQAAVMVDGAVWVSSTRPGAPVTIRSPVKPWTTSTSSPGP